MSRKWTLKVELHSYSAESLKRVFAQAAQRIAKAATPNDFRMGWGESGGEGYESGCSSELTCPIEDHIAELRREADRLEASLRTSH